MRKKKRSRTLGNKRPRSKPLAVPVRRVSARPNRTSNTGGGNTKAKAVKVVELAPCKFCEKMVDKSDMFCFGCKTVICDTCDVSMGTYGHGHSPEAHRVPPEEVTW